MSRWIIYKETVRLKHIFYCTYNVHTPDLNKYLHYENVSSKKIYVL